MRFKANDFLRADSRELTAALFVNTHSKRVASVDMGRRVMLRVVGTQNSWLGLQLMRARISEGIDYGCAFFVFFQLGHYPDLGLVAR